MPSRDERQSLSNRLIRSMCVRVCECEFLCVCMCAGVCGIHESAHGNREYHGLSNWLVCVCVCVCVWVGGCVCVCDKFAHACMPKMSTTEFAALCVGECSGCHGPLHAGFRKLTHTHRHSSDTKHIFILTQAHKHTYGKALCSQREEPLFPGSRLRKQYMPSGPENDIRNSKVTSPHNMEHLRGLQHA